MMVQENFALFVDGTDVRWSFGNPSDDFVEIVSNFLMGLSSLGQEFFGEGIASITFDRRRYSGIKASEIFIVSLEDRFFLIISDPAVTLLLIAASGGIPSEIKDIMRAVLIGQASILYSRAIMDADAETKQQIDTHFQEILLDLNERFRHTPVVGPYGSHFSILNFEEALLLHYYLRKHAEKRITAPAGRAIIANLEGWKIPLAYGTGMDDRSGVWAGFFAAIIGFIQTLFDSKPKYITFGSTELHKLRFIYGEKHFMALDTSIVSDLLLRKAFRTELFGINYGILKDISNGVKSLIIEEIQSYSEDKLNELSVETLIDTYAGEDQLLDLTIDERVLKIWGKLLIKYQK
ncbi:MAG: hypothetical protein ACFFE8_12175 [Candidatus Heimdallarchaeota archaeon]